MNEHSHRGHGGRRQQYQYSGGRRGRGYGQHGRGSWRGSRGGGRGGPPGRYNNNNHHKSPSGASSSSWQHHDDTRIEEFGSPHANTITIAIEGCCHGELDAIYERLQKHEQDSGRKIDLLLCCGDFQSLRNEADFHSLAVPAKYRSMGSFYKYYSGERKAPFLTFFVGGNHEASQALQELGYGGWVAPNIYYIGFAGVINYNGLRIGGLSGIFKSHDYNLGRFERPPYDRSTMRSVYHVRSMDVYRLKCLRGNVDVFLSHDWPNGIEQYGDTEALLRKKPFFREEVATHSLGSPPNRELLDTLRPKYWFAAHLHVKFHAVMQHPPASDGKTLTSDAAELIPSQVIGSKTTPTAKHVEATHFIAPESSTTSCSFMPDLSEQMTTFLSLDKCLPRRHYLSIVHIPVDVRHEDPQLEYDVEWLAILRKTHHLTSVDHYVVSLPSDPQHVSNEDEVWVNAKLKSRVIPHNFVQTVPAHGAMSSSHHLPPPLSMMGNPQTDELLDRLELPHLFTIPFQESQLRLSSPPPQQQQQLESHVDDENEINVDDLDDDSVEDGKPDPASNSSTIELQKGIEDGDDDGGVETCPKKRARM